MRQYLMVVAAAISFGTTLRGQDTTSLGCDAMCLASLSRLSAGAQVDVWARDRRVQGRFVRLERNELSGSTLLITGRVDQDTALRVVRADDLQSINVSVSNARRYAVYGLGAGAALGAMVGIYETGMNLFGWPVVESSRHPFHGGRFAAAVALGAIGGTAAGALIGTRVPRWERIFARTLGR
jgi:hypothetical protein